MQSSLIIKKQWFITSNTGKVDERYDFKINPDKALGAGTYGSVFVATEKGTGVKRAIKCIEKKKVKNQERFKTEIDIMIKLDHPNVIKLYETYEDTKYLYLVMELCEGGELFDKIVDAGKFGEAQARDIFKQMMQAINYCHKNGICHRDLKPENYLLVNKKDDLIKIIDFGLSSFFLEELPPEKTTGERRNSKMQMHTKAGTPYYISPEVLKGDYDESCDVWSSGVILYILLSGVPPFYGNTDPEILNMVKKGVYSFDIPEFKGVSEAAKDLIKKMITAPQKRLNSQQVLEHFWLKEKIENNVEASFNYSHFKKFQNYDKLKRTALSYIAQQCSENEITELGKLFRSLDKNQDGVLTIDEIKKVLESNGSKNTSELSQVINSIDTDGSGVINYTEFLAASIEKSKYMKKEKIHQAFKLFDRNNNNFITAGELKEVLGSEIKETDMSYWENMIKEADVNGDGKIDYDEFASMMERDGKL